MTVRIREMLPYAAKYLAALKPQVTVYCGRLQVWAVKGFR